MPSMKQKGPKAEHKDELKVGLKDELKDGLKDELKDELKDGLKQSPKRPDLQGKSVCPRIL